MKLKDKGLIKKSIYGISLLVGLFGILLTLVLGFLIYGALDGGEKVAEEQMDAIIANLDKAKEELANVDSSLSDFQSSMASLEESVELLGTSINTFASGVSDLGLVSIEGAGDGLLETADGIDAMTAGLSNHTQTISELEVTIDNQKEKLIVHKSTVRQMFSDLKLGVIVCLFIQLCMFGMLILVSGGQFL